MSKNLTFKLILDGDSKGLVSAAKQSEDAAKKALDAIKNGTADIVSSTSDATKEFEQFSDQTAETAKQVQVLDKELGNAQQEFKETENATKLVSGELQGLKTGFNAVTGALAALGIGATAQEIAQTADEYKNLSGRISIAIGEHGNLGKAMEDVKNIAIATNSNLTATGDLYSRLTKIGQEAHWSQEQVLGLTETINKAIQVGGGSAQANEAAITQLNQALGSGVLRGDEFNSMMEQSPRLAQALADGLGVTTGKLRELAGEGKLTTEVVTNALLSQSEKISAEFAKFPATIGASIENLKTAWTVYIGEADAATGASEKVANALKFVAENLDTIVSTLTLAGQAFIAYKALNIANVFLDKAVGIKAASTAIAQETTAVIANTQAQIANTAATRSAAAAKTQFAASSSSAATSAATTGGSIMTLVSRLGALGVAITAVGVLIPTVFQPLGTWIGEGIAKLQGYDQALKDLEKQEQIDAARAKVVAESKAEIAAAAEKNREKTYQLTEESKKLIATFDELIKKGEKVPEVLKAIQEELVIDSTKGINDAVTALVALERQGKITAEQLKASLKEAMSGEDLVVFEANAKAAFANTTFEAQKMALVIEQAMVLAVERTGLSFEQLQGKGSAASRSLVNDVQIIIDSLEKLKDQGIDTALALNQSISKAIDGAETQQQLNIIRGQISGLKSELGETVTNGLLHQLEVQAYNINRELDQMKAGINSVNEAFSVFGLRSRDEARLIASEYKSAYEVLEKSGQATSEQLQQAFRKYAEVAVQANNGIVDGFTNAKAAALGLEVKVDDAGRVTVKNCNDMEQSIHRVRQATGAAGDGFDRLREKGVKAGNDVADSWEEARQAVASGTDEFREGLKKQGEALSKALYDYNSYTKDDVIAAIKSKGYSDSEAKKLAASIWSQGLQADRDAKAQSLGRGGGALTALSNAEFDKAMKLGKTTQNGTNKINELLQNIQVASSGLGSYAPSTPGASSPASGQASKNVKYDIQFGGQTLSVYGDEGTEDTMSKLIKQLQGVAKST